MGGLVNFYPRSNGTIITRSRRRTIPIELRPHICIGGDTARPEPESRTSPESSSAGGRHRVTFDLGTGASAAFSRNGYDTASAAARKADVDFKIHYRCLRCLKDKCRTARE